VILPLSAEGAAVGDDTTVVCGTSMGRVVVIDVSLVVSEFAGGAVLVGVSSAGSPVVATAVVSCLGTGPKP